MTSEFINPLSPEVPTVDCLRKSMLGAAVRTSILLPEATKIEYITTTPGATAADIAKLGVQERRPIKGVGIVSVM